MPRKPTAKPVTIFISGAGLETIMRDGIEVLLGSINGETFEVPCNQVTDVSPEIAGVLAGIIAKQGRIA